QHGSGNRRHFRSLGSARSRDRLHPRRRLLRPVMGFLKRAGLAGLALLSLVALSYAAGPPAGALIKIDGRLCSWLGTRCLMVNSDGTINVIITQLPVVGLN